MEFDWATCAFDLGNFNTKDIEESFEDPFSIRLLPETEAGEGREARYFCLGKSLSGRGIFSVFWTDGKRYRVIFARAMTPAEEAFFERKNLESNY